jgi:hypothetical protein
MADDDSKKLVLNAGDASNAGVKTGNPLGALAASSLDNNLTLDNFSEATRISIGFAAAAEDRFLHNNL